MALFTSIFASPFSVASPIGRCPLNTFKRFTHPIIASSLSSPSSPESKSSSAPSQTVVSSTETSANAYPASSRPPEPSFNYAFANGSLFAWFAKSVESSIERIIFDFPFLALLAVGGSLAVLRLVEAIGKFSELAVLRLVEAIDAPVAKGSNTKGDFAWHLAELGSLCLEELGPGHVTKLLSRGVFGR